MPYRLQNLSIYTNGKRRQHSGDRGLVLNQIKPPRDVAHIIALQMTQRLLQNKQKAYFNCMHECKADGNVCTITE